MTITYMKRVFLKFVKIKTSCLALSEMIVRDLT